MNKHPFKRIFIAFLTGVLICFSNVSPLFSQSSLNACFANAAAAEQCKSAGIISKSSSTSSQIANTFGRTGSLPTLSKSGALAVAGVVGLTALGYTKLSLDDLAVPNANCWFYPINGNSSTGYGWGKFNGTYAGAVSIMRTYFGSSPPYPVSCGSGESFPPNANTQAALNPSDWDNLSDSAKASAWAGASAINSLPSVSSIPISQAEADRLKGLGVPDYAPTANDNADPLDDTLDTSKPLDNKLDGVKDPSQSSDPSKPAAINFLAYALTVFSSKFPFDFFYSPPVADFSLSDCPSFTFFYYRFQFCFLVPLFNALRWIITIGVALKMIYTL